MDDIKQAIYQRLETDSTLRTLTGWTAADPRIYCECPPEEIDLSATKPGYMTIALKSLGTRTGPDGESMPDETYSLDIWSFAPGTNETVLAQILDLLDDWPFETTDHRGMKTELMKAFDSYDSKSGTYRKTTEWKVRHIMKKA